MLSAWDDTALPLPPPTSSTYRFLSRVSPQARNLASFLFLLVLGKHCLLLFSRYNSHHTHTHTHWYRAASPPWESVVEEKRGRLINRVKQRVKPYGDSPPGVRTFMAGVLLGICRWCIMGAGGCSTSGLWRLPGGNDTHGDRSEVRRSSKRPLHH